MRIIQCVPYFLPSNGGTERATFCLSKELVRLGHEVKVLTFDASLDMGYRLNFSHSQGMMPYEVIEGVEVYRFKTTCLLHPSSIFSLSLYCSLLKANPDIIHLQGFQQLSNLVPEILFSRVTNNAVVLTDHGLHETISMLSSSYFLFRYPASRFINTIMKSLAGLIALNRRDKQILIKMGIEPRKIHHIPNGVDIESFGDNATPLSNMSEKFHFPPSRVVLCVSRIARNKGLHNLLIAASFLKTNEDLIFLVVGHRSDELYRLELAGLIEKLNLSRKVIFLEDIPDKDLVSLYKHATVFVLPSKEETLPLVILEAMAAGCPVIATRVGGIPEIVDNGRNGILVDPEDPKELARWIEILLKDQNMRVRLAEKGKQIAMDYSWKEVARRTLITYNLVLE